MNLFCFTLDGSTESIYEPAYSHALKEVVLPKYQCSPGLLRCNPEWGGSDPALSSERAQNAAKLKRSNRRSRVTASLLDGETLEKDINHACWMSPGHRKDLSHQNKAQSRDPTDAGEAAPDDGVRGPSSDGTQTDLPAQGGRPAPESAHTKRRLRKLQSLVHVRKGHRGGGGCGTIASQDSDDPPDVAGGGNPVLTCIGLGRRAGKSPGPAASPAPPPPPQGARDPQAEGAWGPWSPLEGPHPWPPFPHTCRGVEWGHGGHALSLPRAAEWDRFESLTQELGDGRPRPPPPQMIRSITDLHLSQNTLARFGRFDASRQHSPLMKARDHGSCLRTQAPGGDADGPGLRGKRAEASPETAAAATTTIKGDAQKDEAWRREAGGGRPFTKGHRLSTNSLESLYSLHSGQSSSSGVTSGSDCSSNRGSLRLEDDLLYARQSCGRARVHTDYVPSPYDTESLKLKVGDVIDIITKPPMGIWTGVLNGRTGNFKFIYVDVLTEESPERRAHKARHKSTVREVLKRLSLEEYSSSLQQNGYQTVADLMRLREHHLMELNVTDPEHRRRLLAAVDSLQQLRSDSQLENEANQEAETPGKNAKADMNNCSRDSGCPDNSAEDADLPFPSESPLPAEMTAS